MRHCLYKTTPFFENRIRIAGESQSGTRHLTSLSINNFHDPVHRPRLLDKLPTRTNGVTLSQKKTPGGVSSGARHPHAICITQ